MRNLNKSGFFAAQWLMPPLVHPQVIRRSTCTKFDESVTLYIEGTSAMQQRDDDTDLIELGMNAVGVIAANASAGGSPVYAQLVASEFFEALQAELQDTPSQYYARRGALAAAIDQCRRAATTGTNAGVALAELRAALAIIDAPTPAFPTTPQLRPRLRGIEGGRA